MPPARITLWVATVGALTWALRSVSIGPPPFWLALGLMFSYLALCGVGIVFPRLEMFADVIDRGPAGNHRVALTFDDGPDPVTTPKVLQALAQHGFKATFFVIARKAEQHPELLQNIVDQGHELGLHGYAHDRLTAWHVPSRIVEDIRKAQTVLRPFAGRTVFWYRPPIGHVSPRTATAARKADVEIVTWSVRCLDGLARANPKRIVRCLERKLCDGGIVMLHDAAERSDFEPAAVKVIDELLNVIVRRGFTSVTLSELLVDQGDASARG